MAHSLRLDRAVLHLGCGFYDLLRTAEHILVCLCRLSAYLQLQLCRFTDDVAARACMERADIQLRRRAAETGDGVQI